MKNKLGQLSKILIALIALLLLSNITVYAGVKVAKGGGSTDSSDSITIGTIVESVKRFKEEGKKDKTIDAEQVASDFAKGLKPIIDLLIYVGSAVCILGSIVMGARYAMAIGKPDELAKLKVQLIGFLVATAIFLIAYPIWNFTVNFINDIVEKI